MAQKRWSDLTPGLKRLIVGGGAVEVVLTTAALRDLRRRSADEVRGPRLAWVAAMAVQPFGPLGYFAFGRKG